MGIIMPEPTARDPYADGPPILRLDALKVAFEQRIGASFADRLELHQVRDVLTGDILARVSSRVLAEELPPVTVADRVPFTVPRHATWFDHLVATYRGRWWARLLRWHRRELRYVDEPHMHRVDVKVRTHWTYPRATTVLPGRDYGHVVLKSQTANYGEARPWSS